jgi:hypothetical protein
MPFDISTAVPEKAGGFDISMAKPEEPKEVTQPAYMDQLDQLDADFYRQAGITTPEEARAVQNSKDFVLRGLPDDVRAKLLSKWAPEPSVAIPTSPYAPMQAPSVDKDDYSRLKAMADMERLRVVNPFLVEDIESRGALETGVVGAGEKVDAVLRGAGELTGFGTGRDETEQQFAKALKSRPSAKVGGAIAELSTMAVPGAAAQRIPQIAGRMATQGAMTGTEQALTALGEGKSGKEAAIQGGLGALAGGAFGALPVSPAKPRSTPINQYIDDIIKGAKRTPAAQAEEVVPKIGSKAEIRKALEEGTVEAAGWRLGEKGNVQRDGVQVGLLRAGVDERLLAASNKASPADKASFKEMLKLARDSVRGVEGSQANRPQRVIGRNAMKRFDFLASKQKDASQRIGDAVKNDLEGVPVNINKEFDQFIDDLEALGVRFDEGRINFKESGILGSATGPVRQIYNMSKSNYPSASQLHELKKNISKQLSYDSPLGKKVDVDAERAINSFRASINEKLRGMSDNYAMANDEFASIADAFTPFIKNMGRKFDPQSDRVDAYVGQELRKVLTNYQKSSALLEDIQVLDAKAKEFGGSFDDDILKQVVLNNELERVLGSFAPAGAQSMVERGGAAAADVMLPNAVSGPVKSVAKSVKDMASIPAKSKEKIKIIDQLVELYSRNPKQ